MNNKQKLYLSKCAGFLYKELDEPLVSGAAFPDEDGNPGNLYPTGVERYAEPRWFTRPFTTTHEENIARAGDSALTNQAVMKMLKNNPIPGLERNPFNITDEDLTEENMARWMGDSLIEWRPRMYRREARPTSVEDFQRMMEEDEDSETRTIQI
tara:strand:- start:152 stop:613 length:462 start_codon:yes stop_codon:yes gene_type:complete